MANSRVSIAAGLNTSSERFWMLKLQSTDWEMNLRINPDELGKLSLVRDAVWTERRSLCLGACADAKAFWTCEGDVVSVLVGQDDETWDFGVVLPPGMFERIVSAALEAEAK